MNPTFDKKMREVIAKTECKLSFGQIFNDINMSVCPIGAMYHDVFGKYPDFFVTKQAVKSLAPQISGMGELLMYECRVRSIWYAYACEYDKRAKSTVRAGRIYQAKMKQAAIEALDYVLELPRIKEYVDEVDGYEDF